MKKYFLIIVLLSIAAVGFCQQADSAWVELDNYPLAVNSLKVDFGTIMQDEKQSYKFEIKNLANKPLVIWHVSTSCGCTSPNWTKKPVQPGEEASVKVKFKSADLGVFHKSVFVYTNFNDKPVKLQLTGNIVLPKADSQLSKQSTNFKATIPETNK